MASPSPYPTALQSKLLEIREQIQNEHKQRGKDNLFNPLISPGPASIALLNNKLNQRFSSTTNTTDHTTPRNAKNTAKNDDNNNNDNDDDATNNSTRGMYAAAALNAAVTRPLPLKRGNLKQAVTKNKKWAVQDNYIVSKNDNIITCSCGTNKKVDSMNLSNDGFLQCNHCHRWQHLNCYNLKTKMDVLPNKFYCKICKPNLDSDSYRINKKKKLLQKQQKEKINDLNLQIQIQIQKQLNLNILNQKSSNNNKININSTGTIENKNDSENESPHTETHSPLNSEDKCSPTQSRLPFLSSDLQQTRSNSEVSEDNFESYQYRDKYIKAFVDDHSNDDWVFPINKKMDVLVDSIESRAVDEKTIGVFAKRDIVNKSYITEFFGMVDFQKNYTSNPINQYRIWATAQPEVIFHPHWPILIDARSLDGTNPKNCIKFIRRSCNPNVTMSTVKIMSQITNKIEVYFMINAIKDIKQGDELLIGWQWDLRHPISRVLHDTNAFEHMTDMDKLWLIHAIDIIWQSCRCGCSDRSQCKLFKIKEFADTFLEGLKQKKKRATA